jgi:hypothetical protein
MAYFTKNLGVPTVIYTTVPIEYPATSPDGVATIFSVQGWKDHMDAFNDVSKTNIYSYIYIILYLLINYCN